MVFLPCHLGLQAYVAPSYACQFPHLPRASLNTASSVKSSTVPSTRIHISLFCIARAIYMLFGSFGDSFIQ